MKVKVLFAQLFATPWTVAHQAPLSMGFSRQEFWSGLPCPPPGDLPNPRIEPIPFGSLRLKSKGSDAGHNGLKHIAETLGTQNYARLRFGIGNDFPRGHQIDYVLGEFTEDDMKTMEERLKIAGDIIKSFCLAGINITMNQYNKK